MDYSLPPLRTRLVWAAIVVAALSGVYAGPSLAQDEAATVVSRRDALTDSPRRMAEAAVAVDPADPDRIAAAADPYRNPVRIVVSTSSDAGVSWEPGRVLVPPGFSKTFDPSVAFLSRGRLLVVGGASSGTKAYCQPQSAIFAALLDGADVSYAMIQPPSDQIYVDRPKMIADGADVYVTWTESRGRGAECLAAPQRSVVKLAHLSADLRVISTSAVPTGGFTAPFGSSLAVDGQKDVQVALTDRDPGRTDRIVVAASSDKGRTFEAPQVVASFSAFPSGITGVGGFTSAVPSLAAGPGGDLVVSWSEPVGGAFRVRVARRSAGGGGWADLPAPSSANISILPSVAYDSRGGIWLASAEVAGGTIQFWLRHYDGSWDPPLDLGSGSSGTYAEIGQFIGLAVAGERIAAAVPLDGPAQSRLAVGVFAVKPRPTPAQARPSGRSPSPPPGSGRALGVVAVVVIGAALLTAGLLRGRLGGQDP